jgi:GT2 family glycosyltransferase
VEVDAVKGCFLFCANITAKRLNGLDERFYFYMEETDFCYRLKKTGGKVYFFPGSEIIHLDGASTENVQWFKFKNQTIAKIQFFQKHAGRGLKFFVLLSSYYLGILLRIFVYLVIGCLRFNKQMLKKSVFYLRELTIYPANRFSEEARTKNI